MSWILSVFRNYNNSLFFFCFCVSFICIILIFVEKTESKCLTSEIHFCKLPLLCLKLCCFLSWPCFFLYSENLLSYPFAQTYFVPFCLHFTLFSNLSIFPTSFILQMIDTRTSTVSTALLFIPNKYLWYTRYNSPATKLYIWILQFYFPIYTFPWSSCFI